ncbi:hypothetical protein [Flavobacterium sp. LC2016-12]|uniref:hypothetical protein n=1 Tax=Flavobacterium sp. LC2016-12 TaxID=2783794 RepID=UPI00188ABBFF|nr:hypothetical protein [Flavobacterium sp. LC2016-12]MBF4465161.1 hypothetical protein [Flavobacterium sp. LC2016-12]
MKSSYKLFLFLLFCMIAGCHYHKVNMTIRNETDKKIGYSTFALTDENKLYDISSGGDIDPNGYDSPFVRGSSDGIKTDINSYPDKSIYFVFFNCEDREFVNKNIDSMFKMGKLKLMKFSKTELDSLDWKIVYTGK